MGTKYLLDTNIVIDLFAQQFPEKAEFFVAQIMSEDIFLSVINKIELLGFSECEKEMSQIVEIAQIFYLDEIIAQKTIEIRKKYKIKLPDAIIAATAICENLVLLSNNENDFKNIKELKFLNPRKL
ncbi:MAG: type II toxin-antitoxin system VapC family toxin [Chitinivibrionia bacterium]|nr:type II toxin-antitoxin system VapC family toxin [Chitinivibrionia bacterium]